MNEGQDNGDISFFCNLRNSCLVVVRGNAAQRYFDGRHHPSKLGTEKGTFVNLF